MGIEGLSLFVESFVSPDRVKQVLQDIGFTPLLPDAIHGEACFFEWSPGEFILEARIERLPGGWTKLLLELALCNPPEADSALSTVVGKVLLLGDFEAWFMTGISPLSFSSKRHGIGEVTSAVDGQAIGMRARWQSHFGTRMGPVRISDAFGFVSVL